jgi:hypothetical protein
MLREPFHYAASSTHMRRCVLISVSICYHSSSAPNKACLLQTTSWKITQKLGSKKAKESQGEGKETSEGESRGKWAGDVVVMHAKGRSGGAGAAAEAVAGAGQAESVERRVEVAPQLQQKRV